MPLLLAVLFWRHMPAKFKRYTYNGVTVQATGRRSSDRPNKAWVRTVRQGDSERLVHYADPDMPMRRTNPAARRNFLSRHNCSSKRDPLAPGFWACYDWANPSEKEVNSMEEQEVYQVEDEAQEVKMCGKPHDKMDYDDGYSMAMMGATSFAELHAAEMASEAAEMVEDLTEQFQLLSGNIMMDDTIEDKAAALGALASEYAELVAAEMSASKERWQPLTDRLKNFIADHTKQEPMKTEDGIKYPAEDFAYTPDLERPSGWKLRLSEGRPGNITRAQLGRAAQALAPGGFMGNRVEIPAADLDAVKRKIRAAYRKLGVEVGDMPPAVKERSGLMVWKDAASGRYRWLAIYSNNYRDRDNPPEILSAQAHKEFVAVVDAGEWPYPQAWLWHEKGTRYGQADMVHYDEDTGFALAAGFFDEGKERVALALAQSDVLVSHGMPVGEIQRDKDDPTVITRYRTTEISPLPPDAAANPLTGFEVVQEVKSMTIPAHKLEFIQGLDPDAIQADLEDKKTQAEAEQLESKEADIETEAKEETPPVEAEAPQEPVAPQLDLVSQLGEAMGVALNQALAPLVERLDALESKAAEPEPEPEPVEPLSVAGAFIKAMQEASAIGAPEARVDGRSTLAKDGPKENDPSTKNVINTGKPIVDDIFGSILSGKFQDQMRSQIGGA